MGKQCLWRNTVLRHAQDERLCVGYLAISTVFPAKA
jgi:hypothetical protein